MVIAALNEEEQVTGAIQSAREAGAEIIVVDGGSRDSTRSRAEAAGALVLSSPRGRAQQLETGARASRGDVIVFLHADTRLPTGYRKELEKALKDREVAGGAFGLRFDQRTPALRLVEWLARRRASILGLPYGDQALFVRREVLAAIGGVPSVPIMEDLDLVIAMRRRGRLALLSSDVVTSARRYRSSGVMRTAAAHLLATLAWAMGIERARIAGWLRS
ncbi:TIGR04283 family arsenosugar biosynthesis glycosyltransferase [Myxococcota bacterium]|nr:TIGR04283 family arsenosugar biosynthesis glycosyltransferase [Myxococcota bacterium]